MFESILITGGAGFVGSSLALALKKRFPACQVKAMDSLHRRGSELNLRRLSDAGVVFIHGDIRLSEDFEALGDPPQLLIECSAEPSAQAGYGGSPEFLIQTNLVGCFRCLEYARRVNSDVLFLSTSRVYPVEPLNSLRFREDDTRFTLLDEQPVRGASSRGVSEDFPLEGARSLYGMTKLAGELMAAEYAAAYGIRYLIDRCGLIAGPWQMGKTDQGVVALWLAAHYFGRPLDYIGFGGTGKQVRDMLHIDDLGELVIRQCEDFDRWSGRLFNVGGGLAGSLSLGEMTALCRRITGKTIPIGSRPETRPADLRIYIADHARLTEFSGWKPARGPQKILADIYEWVRAEESLVRRIFLA